MKHVTETPADQIWFKSKRVWRTIFSAVLTGAVVVPQLLAIVNDAWPTDALTAVLAQAVIVQGVITRVMANETVNRLLAYIGIGSAPKEYLVAK
jgi:hypothetical protein